MFRDIPAPPSKNVKYVAHDDETQTLRITFQNGRVYDYAEVDSNKADGFSSAESAGRYLQANIVNQHVATRIT